MDESFEREERKRDILKLSSLRYRKKMKKKKKNEEDRRRDKTRTFDTGAMVTGITFIIFDKNNYLCTYLTMFYYAHAEALYHLIYIIHT